ncbi:MAG TPA: AMP-binding protein, partial [Puia sp.]
MPEPKRLFDCLTQNLERDPLPDMLAGKVDGVYKTHSTREVAETVEKLSAGLLRLGVYNENRTVEGIEKIGIVCKNRPEWIMLDLAAQRAGAVLAPVYPTISENELQFILNDSQVRFLFVNDKDLFHKVQQIRDKVPSLQEVFTIEPVPGARHWEQLLVTPTPEETVRLKRIQDAIHEDDLVTVIYTSGTTGTPKGVMLSHRNIVSNVWSCMPCLPQGKIRALSFLPLNHIYERMLTYVYLFNNSSIYYAESMDTIGDNLKEVKPQMFVTVPRLLEKVYDRIMHKGNELTGIKRKLFFWAHDLAARYEINKPMGAWYDLQLSLANKLIFSKWREALGNN